MPIYSSKDKIRDEVVRIVNESPPLSRRARAVYKRVKRAYLRLAALGKGIMPDAQGMQNVYHASIQRTGSRWIRKVFSDPRIQQYSGLWTYPQHEYEIRDHHDTFPKYTFVPGLYISYEQYLRIQKPDNYRTFYVIRDPRNVTISWYRAMKDTHKLVNESVSYYRQKLSNMSEKDGLKEAIKLYQVKISFMKDWFLQAKNNPNIFIVKFEDITEYPKSEFKKIFDRCHIDVPDNVLGDVINEKNKSRMRKRDKRRRSGAKSDYRKKTTDWKEIFDIEHLKEFEKINGKVASTMGYKS